MSGELVGFGPSLVDVSAQLSPDTYAACDEILQVGPGGYVRLSDHQTLERLLEIVTGDPIPHTVDSLRRHRNVSLVAGSSVLGMFGAMNPSIRSHATLVTTSAIQGQNEDSFSTFFQKSVHEAGVNHMTASSVEGHNPLGVVLSVCGQGQGEKTMAMYPGVASEMDQFEQLESLDPRYVFVDAYELRGNDKMSIYLDKIIRSQQYRIALSLGNRTILDEALRIQLRQYIESGCIDALCGNDAEFGLLYGDMEPGLMGEVGFEQHPVKNSVPYVLLTRGNKGISTHWNGTYLNTAAYPIADEDIINTSGAGDTAMGVYCAGIVDRAGHEETALKATYMATKVLRVPGSMIIATE